MTTENEVYTPFGEPGAEIPEPPDFGVEEVEAAEDQPAEEPAEVPAPEPVSPPQELPFSLAARLRKGRAEAREEADALRKELEDIKSRLPDPPDPDSQAPDPDKDPQGYLRWQTSAAVREEVGPIKEAVSKLTEQAQAAQIRREQDDLYNFVSTSANQAMARYDDYQEVVGGYVEQVRSAIAAQDPMLTAAEVQEVIGKLTLDAAMQCRQHGRSFGEDLYNRAKQGFGTPHQPAPAQPKPNTRVARSRAASRTRVPSNGAGMSAQDAFFSSIRDGGREEYAAGVKKYGSEEKLDRAYEAWLAKSTA